VRKLAGEQGAFMEEVPGEKLPRVWIGQRVNLIGVQHIQSVLRGVKTSSGSHTRLIQINQLFYVPWLQLKIEAICFLPTMSRRTSCQE
jgi:hypothetical protein